MYYGVCECLTTGQRLVVAAANWDLSVNGVSLSGGALFDGDAFSRANPFDLAAGSGGPDVLNVAVSAGDIIRLSFLTNSSFGEFVGVNLTVGFDPDGVPEPAGVGLVALGLVAAAVRRSLGTRRRASRR